MGYVEENLQRDEEIVIRAEFSMWGAVSGIIGLIVMLVCAIIFFVIGGLASKNEFLQTYCVICGIVFLVLGVLAFVYVVLSIKSNELVVTNKRIIGKRGLFGKHITDIPIDRVDSVTVQIPLFGQLFHYNNIRINTAGSYGVGTGNAAANMFPAVTNANDIKNIINQAIELHAAEARRAQAVDIADVLQKK